MNFLLPHSQSRAVIIINYTFLLPIPSNKKIIAKIPVMMTPLIAVKITE
jgi:hypothetical protein